MLTDSQRLALEAAWAPARAEGVLGTASILALDEQAAGFVPAAWRSGPLVGRAIDLGTGAGVPGVLLAAALPATRWRLLDASQRRCDHATAAVHALDLGERVAVVHARADELVRSPRTGLEWRGWADLVVTRLFGPPAETAECSLPLVRLGGRVVVSVSAATAAQWRGADLGTLGGAVVDDWSTSAGRYIALERVAPGEPGFPRRTARRRRDPLF